MQAAIAAKEAQEAAAAEANAAKDAAAPPKPRSRFSQLRGAVSFKHGVKKVWFLKCKEDVNYTGWSNHCSRHHPVNVTGDVGEQSKDDDGNGDDGNTVSKRKKPKAGIGQNEPKAAASKRCRKDSSGDKGTTCKKVKPL